MFSRITTGLLENNLLAALNVSQQDQNNALTAVETQRSVNVPSDNPAAAALYSSSLAASSQTSQFLQNINSLTGKLQVGDAALGSAVSMLTRAVTLGTEGANGTLSSSDMKALGQEVGQIQQQMIAVANTTFQGSYIFNGTAGGPAYKADSTSPDGVTYLGNGNVNQVEIAAGAQTAANVAGSQIFQNSSGSVFQALQDLKTALNSGNSAAVVTANGSINAALNQLNQQRVFYGATVDRLTSTQSYLNSEALDLTQQQTTLVGVDMSQALTTLSSAELARSAILAAGSRIGQASLLNTPPSLP